jgi:hypothetical protein
MQLTTALAEMLESGKVVVSANNVEALEIKADNKKIDITALSKEFVKDALAATRDTKKGKGLREGIKGTVGQIKNARGSLELLKVAAEELSAAGLTVTLSYKGSVVVTLGSEANPKLSNIATGTKAIEINSTRKLVELGV